MVFWNNVRWVGLRNREFNTGCLEKRCTFTVLYLMMPLFPVQGSMTQISRMRLLRVLTYNVTHDMQRPVDNSGFQLCSWTGNVEHGSARLQI
jgi:hypothetical protein